MGTTLTQAGFDRHEQLARDVVDHIARDGDIRELVAIVDSAEYPALLVHFVTALAYRAGYADAGADPGRWACR